MLGTHSGSHPIITSRLAPTIERFSVIRSITGSASESIIKLQTLLVRDVQLLGDGTIRCEKERLFGMYDTFWLPRDH
jgi:hypothetical protein